MYGSCAQDDLPLQSFSGCTMAILGQSFLVPEEPHYMAEGEILTPCVDYDLLSLPIPCLITIEGIEYEVTELPTFSFDAPGTYDLYIVPGDARFKDKVISYESST
jgi:hypothetical protein